MNLTHEELVEIIWSHTDAIDGRVRGVDEAAWAILEHEEFCSRKNILMVLNEEELRLIQSAFRNWRLLCGIGDWSKSDGLEKKIKHYLSQDGGHKVYLSKV